MTARVVLQAKARDHQDWFDKNNEQIQAALVAKNKAYTEWKNDSSSVTKREKFKKFQTKVQSDLRDMQDQWRQHKAEEVQRYADTHNAKHSSAP